MKPMPMYRSTDGSYTFEDNGTVPTPFHLLKPHIAFAIAENMTQAQRDRYAFSFVDLRGDGSIIMLYMDAFTPVCARLSSSMGEPYYSSPKGAFDTLTNREKIESGAMTLKEHLAEEIGSNTTPEQASENMRRYKLMVEILQEIACGSLKIEFYAVPPSKEQAFGEAGFTYEDEASFAFDDMPLLAKAVELASSLDMEHSEVEGQHRMYFLVDNCYTYKQQKQMK